MDKTIYVQTDVAKSLRDRVSKLIQDYKALQDAQRKLCVIQAQLLKQAKECLAMRDTRAALERLDTVIDILEGQAKGLTRD